MTQDEIIEMARDSGMELYGLGKDRARFVYHLVAFVERVVAEEREACAKIAERFEPNEKTSYVTYASTAIRARGQA